MYMYRQILIQSFKLRSPGDEGQPGSQIGFDVRLLDGLHGTDGTVRSRRHGALHPLQ